MRFTQEQREIVNAIVAPLTQAESEAGGGRLFSVPAVAGAGKSLMIVEMARRDAQREILFLCQSRSIADRARATLPGNITVRTFVEAALYFLRMTEPGKAEERLVKYHTPEDVLKLLQEGVTTKEAERALVVLERFYRSPHPHPHEAHLPTHEDWTAWPGDVRGVLSTARAFWFAQQRPVAEGGAPLSFSALVKAWSLSQARTAYYPELDKRAVISPIPAKHDLIIVEEAQLLTSGLLDFLSRQRASLVFFGDGYQALQKGSARLQHQQHPIYQRATTLALHESMRFGPSIASICSALAHKAGAPNKAWVQGAGQSAVYGFLRRDVWERQGQHYLLLANHHATLFGEAIEATQRGKKIAWLNGLASQPIGLLRDLVVLGMGKDRAYRAETARHLIQTPSLRHVPSLHVLLERVKGQPYSLMARLARWVYYLDVPELLRMIDGWCQADNARQAHFSRNMSEPMPRDLTLGTVAQAQGHEWPRVALAEDIFPMGLCGHDWGTDSVMANRAYVAASRAQRGLVVPDMFLAHLRAHGWDLPTDTPDGELDPEGEQETRHAYFGVDRQARLELTPATRKLARRRPQERPVSTRASGHTQTRERMMAGAEDMQGAGIDDLRALLRQPPAKRHDTTKEPDHRNNT